MSTTTLYVTRTQYVADRERQDERFQKLDDNVQKLDNKVQKVGNDVQEIRGEIKTINTRLDHLETDVAILKKDVAILKTDVAILKTDVAILKTDVAILKTDVAGLKTDVAGLKTDMVEVKGTISLLQFEQQRSAAFFRNQLKKIPTLRFEPVPIWDPERGIVFPDNDNFPRDAKEFFDLSRPTTSRALQILRYLILFYDVTWAGMNANISENDVREAMTDENTALAIMDALETRLGLVEENFVAFQQRAHDWGLAQDGNQGRAVRRPPPSSSSQGQPLAVRQRVAEDRQSGTSASADPLAGATAIDSSLNSVSTSAGERARRSNGPSLSSGRPGAAGDGN